MPHHCCLNATISPARIADLGFQIEHLSRFADFLNRGTRFVKVFIFWNLRMNQTTLAKSIETSGTGLHTGVEVNLTLKPAPENTGYIFVRTDLDNFEIPASVEYISH